MRIMKASIKMHNGTTTMQWRKRWPKVSNSPSERTQFEDFSKHAEQNLLMIQGALRITSEGGDASLILRNFNPVFQGHIDLLLRETDLVSQIIAYRPPNIWYDDLEYTPGADMSCFWAKLHPANLHTHMKKDKCLTNEIIVLDGSRKAVDKGEWGRRARQIV